MLILLIALNAQMRRTAAAELALSEGEHAAVANAAAAAETIALSVEKLLVTTSSQQSAMLLSQLAICTDRLQQALSELPDPQGQRAKVNTFLSSVTSAAQTALTELPQRGALSETQRSALMTLRPGIGMLHAELAIAHQTLLQGGKLSTALPASELTAPPTAKELTAYRALPSHEISLGEAMQLAKEFVGVERVVSVSHAPDTTGALPAFGVTVQTSDLQLNLEVTRRGGKILLMSPETAGFPIIKTPPECSAAAIAFLSDRGFAAMEPLWYQVYDGLCVLTCAYVQQDVLIWPDRVAVQVRMDTGEVVGIEARSYWKNHIPRKLAAPLLTQDEAASALSPDAEITAVRRCLLPHDGQERLCWQYAITVDEEDFISYIDAFTGVELLLEKVLQLDIGSTAA